MLDVVTSLYDSVNRNQYSGLVLIDLKKAFDTVSHTTLLKKLHNYSIRGVAQKWSRGLGIEGEESKGWGREVWGWGSWGRGVVVGLKVL